MSIISESKTVTSRREPQYEAPVIERTLDREELRSELSSIVKTRKVIMAAVWVVAVGVMIYGMVNVTPFLIDHGISKYIAPGLPLMVDTALCVSLWGDRVLRKYSLSDGWLTTLRWSTGLMTWLLNIAEPLAGPREALMWSPDWVGVGVHSCGPIMLILVTEAASSFSRKASSIIQTLAKVENEQEAMDGERAKVFAEMEADILELRSERDTLKSNLTSTQGSSSSEIESMKAKHAEELEGLKTKSKEHIQGLQTKNEKAKAAAEMAQGGAIRLAHVLSSTKPSLQDSTTMGRSLISHYAGHEQMSSLLDGSTIPTTDLAKTMGERVHVFTTAENALTVIDKGDPTVRRIVESNDGELSVASIPSRVLVTLQDSDLGAEMIRMVRENDAVNKEEGAALIKALVEGNCDSLDNGFLTRVAVRVAMDTKRIKDSYGRV